jgi:hypothetical protein
MVICGWCGEPVKGVKGMMGAGRRGGRAPAPALAASSAPTSHGICRSCLTDRLAALVRPAAGQTPVAVAR